MTKKVCFRCAQTLPPYRPKQDKQENLGLFIKNSCKNKEAAVVQFWLINNKLCSLSDRYKQGITIRSQHFALSVLKYKKIELFKI